MKIKEAELSFTLLEGEEEETFLKKAVSDMRERRSMQKGRSGRGRGNFRGNKRRNDGNRGDDRGGKRARAD